MLSAPGLARMVGEYRRRHGLAAPEEPAPPTTEVVPPAPPDDVKLTWWGNLPLSTLYKTTPGGPWHRKHHESDGSPIDIVYVDPADFVWDAITSDTNLEEAKAIVAQRTSPLAAKPSLRVITLAESGAISKEIECSYAAGKVLAGGRKGPAKVLPVAIQERLYLCMGGDRERWELWPVYPDRKVYQQRHGAAHPERDAPGGADYYVGCRVTVGRKVAVIGPRSEGLDVLKEVGAK